MKIPPSALSSSDAFAEEIKLRIESGELPDGQKLPRTQDWARQLGVDHRIVQKGLAALSAKGWLSRKPRAGTVVRGMPQKPWIIILLGWPLLTQKGFHASLVFGLKKEIHRRGYRAEVFENAIETIADDRVQRKAALAHLEELLERTRPVGIVQIEFDFNRLSELYQKYRCPCASYVNSGPKNRVYPDSEDFDRVGLRHFREIGCKKVLSVRHHRRVSPSIDLDGFWSEVRRNKFNYAEIREVFDLNNIAEDYQNYIENSAYHLMKEALGEWKERRKNYVPDCIMVDDVIVMKGISTALLEAKHPAVPIIVRSVANTLYEYLVPVAFYDVDIKSIAMALLDVLEGQTLKSGSSGSPRLIKGKLILPQL